MVLPAVTTACGASRGGWDRTGRCRFGAWSADRAKKPRWIVDFLRRVENECERSAPALPAAVLLPVAALADQAKVGVLVAVTRQLSTRQVVCFGEGKAGEFARANQFPVILTAGQALEHDDPPGAACKDVEARKTRMAAPLTFSRWFGAEA